jgi:hypothetical protein
VSFPGIPGIPGIPGCWYSIPAIVGALVVHELGKKKRCADNK